MRKGVSSPEKNSGQRITLNARVIDSKEAFQLYHQGHIIDRMAGFYDQEGYLEPDFYMMDKVARLQALNRYKDMRDEAKEKEKELQADLLAFKQKQAEAAQAAEDERLAKAIARMSQSKTE